MLLSLAMCASYFAPVHIRCSLISEVDSRCSTLTFIQERHLPNSMRRHRILMRSPISELLFLLVAQTRRRMKRNIIAWRHAAALNRAHNRVSHRATPLRAKHRPVGKIKRLPGFALAEQMRGSHLSRPRTTAFMCVTIEAGVHEDRPHLGNVRERIRRRLQLRRRSALIAGTTCASHDRNKHQYADTTHPTCSKPIDQKSVSHSLQHNTLLPRRILHPITFDHGTRQGNVKNVRVIRNERALLVSIEQGE